MNYYEAQEKRNAIHNELVRSITEKIKSCINNEYVFEKHERPYYYFCRKDKVIKVGHYKEEGIFFNDLCFYIDDGTIILANITPLDSLIRISSHMGL